MAASLTEEELARLEALEEADLELIAAMRNALPALLASARAVRNVSNFCRGVIAGAAENKGIEHTSNTVETLTDLANEVLYVIEYSLTATAEPTGGEDDHG